MKIHYCHKFIYVRNSDVNLFIENIQGRGGEELSTELSFALQRCLLGGRSGAGIHTLKMLNIDYHNLIPNFSEPLSLAIKIPTIKCIQDTLENFYENEKIMSLAFFLLLMFQKCMSGAGIDLSSLVIVEGKVCWDLYIDGLVVSSDGNLLDALAAAIKVIVLGRRKVSTMYLSVTTNILFVLTN